MSFSKTLYLPLVIIDEDENIKILTGNEELGIVLYMVEEERGKKGLFKRKSEMLENLALIHYPLIAVKFMNELILLFDPFSDDEAVFEYVELDHDYIEKLISEATVAGGEAFLYKLTDLTNVFKDASSKRAFYKISRYRARSLVTNNKLLEELRIQVPQYVEKRKYSVDLEPRSVDYEKYVNSLEDMMSNQAKEKAYLLNVKTRLKSIVEKWIEGLKEKYGSELRAINDELRTVRSEVENKISEYESLKKEKEDDIRGKYSLEIRQVEDKLKSLEDTRDNLELELAKTKRTGGDTKPIKKKISEVESLIKDLKRRRKDLEDSMKEELDEVRLRYDDLISREQARLRNLESRRESLNRELENYVKQAEEKLRILEDSIHELIASLKESEKNLLDKSIAFKIENKALVYIPVCVASYVADGKRRIHYVTPLRIKRGFRGFTTVFHGETRRFLIDKLVKIHNVVDVAKLVNENNIVKKLTPSEVEVALTTLVNLGLKSRKNIDKAIQSFKNQFFMEK